LHQLLSPVLLLCAQVVLVADPPPGYYDSAQGKTGADLRAALHEIVRNHRSLPYSGDPHPNTTDALGVLDQDPADKNHLVAIYSGYSVAITNIDTTAGAWDREHLWPESYGTRTGPAHTDLHHIRPELASVNDSRSNNYYDVSGPGAKGFKLWTNVEAGVVWSRTASTWEPPDIVKGDIARALLYLVVRYTGDSANEPLLVLTDSTNEIASGKSVMGRYTSLLKWHFADPVSAAERARNDGVYDYQGNRNPFVDHPEWVSAAFMPQVTIAPVGTNIVLAWTNDYAPAVVWQQSVDVFSGWLALTNAPVLTTTNTWTLTMPLDAGPQFYRMRLD
jgi:endonuclease I